MLNRLEIKDFLKGQTKAQLGVLCKAYSLSTHMLKQEIIDELAICINNDDLNDDNFDENSLKAMVSAKNIEDITDMVLNANALESAENVITQDDFAGDNGDFDDERYKTNTSNLGEIVKRVYGMLSAYQKNNNTLNELPSDTLRKVLEGTPFMERIYDIMEYITFGHDELDCHGVIEIKDTYNKEQIARRNMYMMSSMLNKAPSEKQISALTNVITKLMNNEYTCNNVALINKLKQLQFDLNANSWQIKCAIEEGYEELGHCPVTEGQQKFIDSMAKFGVKPNQHERIVDYASASNFIKTHQDEFNRKSLCKLVQKINPSVTEECLPKDKDELKDMLFTFKKNEFLIEQVCTLTGINIWEFIRKIKDMKPSQMLALQQACVNKDLERTLLLYKSYDLK